MGSFGTYTGTMRISEENKEEFTRNILKILNYGGMMRFDKVSIYGHDIILLKPVELNQDGKACFHFNYFEDDAWESACYNANTGAFFCGKIGGREFCDVVTAVHFLYELYDKGVGFPLVNGEIMGTDIYIGWINHVLGKDFSMKKRFRLWDYFEHYCLKKLKTGDGIVESYYVMDTVPDDLYFAIGGTEFSDICYVMEGTDSLREEDIVPGSYPEIIYHCKKLLQQYFHKPKDDENGQVEKIWELVKMNRQERKKIKGKDIYDIAQMSLELPARVLVYLSAEIRGCDFWSVWKELYKAVYKDEVMRQYAPDELVHKRKRAIEKPVKPLTTAEFLYNDDMCLFWNTPKELKGMPDYHISDDDRAFWWDESEEVVLSEKMDAWLLDLAKQHRQLAGMITGDGNPEKFLEELISTLAEIEAYYKRVFAFQNMFYEFLQHNTDIRYIAAVRLLQKLAAENKEAGKIIKKMKNWWDTTSRNVTHNAGRIAMKRYLSVMANKKLREKYFGF